MGWAMFWVIFQELNWSPWLLAILVDETNQNFFGRTG
jgi:hypothetical protein